MDLFPNLEELTIDFTRRGHGEEYAFDTDSLKSHMEIFAQMKNLRTLKLLDVYEPAQDDSKSLVNLEMAMMVKATFCIQILAISHLSRNRYSFQILRPFWWDHLIG